MSAAVAKFVKTGRRIRGDTSGTASSPYSSSVLVSPDLRRGGWDAGRAAFFLHPIGVVAASDDLTFALIRFGVMDSVDVDQATLVFVTLGKGCARRGRSADDISHGLARVG